MIDITFLYLILALVFFGIVSYATKSFFYLIVALVFFSAISYITKSFLAASVFSSFLFILLLVIASINEDTRKKKKICRVFNKVENLLEKTLFRIELYTVEDSKILDGHKNIHLITQLNEKTYRKNLKIRIFLSNDKSRKYDVSVDELSKFINNVINSSCTELYTELLFLDAKRNYLLKEIQEYKRN
jgi:predicted membrane protein